jgi:hypothetical protein
MRRARRAAFAQGLLMEPNNPVTESRTCICQSCKGSRSTLLRD